MKNTAKEVGLKLEAKRAEMKRFLEARTTVSGILFQGNDMEAFNTRNDELRSLEQHYKQLSMNPENLPASGPLPRPESLDQAAQTLAFERIPAPKIDSCTFITDEFTSLCPKTGQPDFGKVTIYYEPLEFGLESKALKYYLWSFRDEGMFCESLAERIADDVFEAIDPRFVRIVVEQFRRGGIGLTVEATRFKEVVRNYDIEKALSSLHNDVLAR